MIRFAIVAGCVALFLGARSIAEWAVLTYLRDVTRDRQNAVETRIALTLCAVAVLVPLVFL